MADLLLDLRQAVRACRRRPVFAAAAISTIALAIGLNTTVFALVNGVLLEPVSLPRPHDVLRIEERHGASPLNLTGATFRDLEARARSFSAVAAFRLSSSTLKNGSEPLRVASATVTRGYPGVIGVPPAGGRAFEAADFAPGARVAMIGEDLWSRVFGRDPSVVGRTLEINAQPTQVVGIIPASAYLPGNPSLLLPIPATDAFLANRRAHLYWVVARVAPGVSPDAARAELSTIARSITQDSAATDGQIALEASDISERLTRSVRPAMLVVWAAVWLVLLIATANVSALLLARATARQRDMAVRVALGGSRARLFRLLAAESGVLGIAGGALGIAIAALALPALRASLPATLPRAADVSLDPRVAGAGLLLALLMTTLFGTISAWRPAAAPATDALRTRDGSSRGGAVRAAIVGAQIAITVVLLVVTGLLGRSMLNAASVSPGFDGDAVLVVNLSLPAARYPDAASHARFYGDVLERLAGTASIESAAVTGALPLGGSPATTISVTGRQAQQTFTADIVPASRRYFDVLRIPLLAGRGFEDGDRRGGVAVAVVSQRAARDFWPGEEAIGQRLTMRDWGQPYEATVVGIVADVHQNGLEAVPTPAVYFPLTQFPETTISHAIVVRHASTTADAAAAVRAAIRAVDPDQPITRAIAMNDILARALAERRFNALLVGVFGAVALSLSAVGLYGLLTFLLASRRREIAVRVALGATPAAIVRLGATLGGRPVGVGLIAGLATALAGGRAASAVLFGVGPRDPATLLAAVSAVAAIALAAAILPLRSAVTADPIDALKAD
jgi:predicted permease